MRYLSLFSGIEAATVAWHPLGWRPVGFAEIEPFPCAVLAHHYPDVPNLGSVTEITDEQIAALGPIDLVVGGSPCQDLSVAGKRNGLAGARSGLFHEQIRIFNAARHFCGARWLLWENVPGAFSSNAGRDFAAVVGAMAGCRLDVPADGWGTEGMALGDAGMVEWAVLDAQWAGVAQRRRRVFALLDAGDWQHRPPILLEPDSLRGDTPPRREAGQGVAPTIAARTRGGGGLGTDFDCDGGLIAGTVSAKWAKGVGGPSGDECQNLVAHRLRGDGFDASEDGTGRGTPLMPVYAIQAGATRENPASGPGGAGIQSDIAYTLEARAEVQAVAFDTTQITSAENGSNPQPGDPCHPLAAGAHPPAIAIHGTQDPDTLTELAHTLGRNQGQENVIAQPYTLAIRGRGDSRELEYRQDGAANALLAPNGGCDGIGVGAVGFGASVRRLTPRECERLQGFPDDYTRIPWRAYQAAMRKGYGPMAIGGSFDAFLAEHGMTPREPAEHGMTLREPAGRECPDGPRYRALGNSMAVPVMRWIGQRIVGDLTASSEDGQ